MSEAFEKAHAHELIERLPASELITAVRFLEFMLLDPVARAAAMARSDDEPVSERDRRRIVEGQEWFAQRGGKGIPMEEVVAECGFRPEDLPLLDKTSSVTPENRTHGEKHARTFFIA